MDMTIIGTKWVYRNTLDENGVITRNKVRLVAQGYNQQKGIDYDETYPPIARLESIRIFLAYACALDFKLYQMDVKSAFLNGFINDEVYVAQPPGFIDFAKPNYVYKFKKALYGMVDNTLFAKKKDSNLIIVQINVDDIIFGSICQEICDDFAKIMHDEFEMSMMGELNFFLGLQIKQLDDGIFFNQSKYIKEMLKKFGLEDSKPIKTPMSMKTKLTRDEEGESVDNTKYRGMIGLWYPKGFGIETIVYADSDHAGDYVDHKSTSDVCMFMGCCLTSWFPKKQTALAISTTEAEYVRARKACQQGLWMKQALIDYGVRLDDIPIMCDNKGAIDLSKNPVQHSQTKHIEIRHHFLRDNVQKGNISIEKHGLDVSANTIANCFRHCKLRSTDNMTFENSDEGGESTQELQNLIKELGYRNAMDVEDVLTHPEENVVDTLLTVEDIIENALLELIKMISMKKMMKVLQWNPLRETKLLKRQSH
ncbi:retrovirus-related pol polyprotein from transposon TNT 1-94 [Tanacetum coccineum]